jgi:FtsP/CotA-like multicopper oxidase with cupredoxin domain
MGMLLRRLFLIGISIGLPTLAGAQGFRVQCPSVTTLHPNAAANSAAPGAATYPAYTGPTTVTGGAPGTSYITNGGQIKCQQVSGGDGYATMADGTQTYMFSFGPLSGLADIAKGLPGTQVPAIFNSLPGPSSQTLPTSLSVGDPATTVAAPGGTFSFNGAVGLTPDPEVASDPLCGSGNPSPPDYCTTGLDGHVDPRPIMDVGVMNGNQPAPLMAIDEDDEFFLTLTNVGMLMRPDLFEQHTIHFHGYPNASSFYDGVPDASVAINIGASMTYYYLAPDAGTYFWHCHITPPEHLQMGMVGQLYVRPRQNRVLATNSLFAALQLQQTDLRTASNCATDVLCTTPLPPSDNGVKHVNNIGGTPTLYAYNDGDGSTAYDVEYPIQIHGFDPNFHFVGMTFNPEGFADMKDKYFLLNGRSYPDTTVAGTMQTPSADGVMHDSQPLPAIINIPAGGKALLRISDLDVSEYQTLASLGIPMTVIAQNARLLRDQAGKNLYYKTNSITLAGGESIDVILDASVSKPDGTAYKSGEVYYLYTPNLDHLSNDAENFGGLMTEVHVN